MSDPTLPIQLPDEMLFAFKLQALIAQLQALTDKRELRGVRYSLDALFLVAVLAQLTA